MRLQGMPRPCPPMPGFPSHAYPSLPCLSHDPTYPSQALAMPINTHPYPTRPQPWPTTCRDHICHWDGEARPSGGSDHTTYGLTRRPLEVPPSECWPLLQLTLLMITKRASTYLSLNPRIRDAMLGHGGGQCFTCNSHVVCATTTFRTRSWNSVTPLDRNGNLGRNVCIQESSLVRSRGRASKKQTVLEEALEVHRKGMGVRASV